MTSFNPKEVYKALYRHKTFQYWRQNDQFKMRHPTEVEWEPCQLATSRLSKGLQQGFIKFISGWTGNEHMKKKY